MHTALEDVVFIDYDRGKAAPMFRDIINRQGTTWEAEMLWKIFVTLLVLIIPFCVLCWFVFRLPAPSDLHPVELQISKAVDDLKREIHTVKQIQNAPETIRIEDLPIPKRNRQTIKAPEAGAATSAALSGATF